MADENTEQRFTRCCRNDAEPMNVFGLSNPKKRFAISLWLFLLAVIVRTGIMLFTIDVPGDGPTRAVDAYGMFLSPKLIMYGVWLPGHSYLHSLFYSVIENPALTSRIVNVILGALTVSFFYFLVAKIFTQSLAMVSALLLIFLPIHIGLSASSLTEPTFLFEFISGSLFLVLAANNEKYQLVYLGLALLLLSLAVTTRYEGWVLVPIFVIYYYARTLSIPGSFSVATVLLIYPAIWTIGNYLHFGDPFFGFTMAKGWFHGAKPVSWLEAISVTSRKFIYHLGWILPVTIVVGIILQLRDLLQKRFSLEKIFYLTATLMYAVVIYRFTMNRGNDLWARYLLFGFVLVLPLAIVPFTYFEARRSKFVRAAVVLLIISVAYNPRLYRSLHNQYNDLYVTFWRPNEIINISDWLKSSPYRKYVVLLTANYDQSWYLPTFFPAKTLHHCVIAAYTEESLNVVSASLYSMDPSLEESARVDYCLTMGKRLSIGNHYLFITSDGDRWVKERIETLVGGEIGRDNLVHTENYVRVYDISHIIEKNQQMPERGNSH